MDLYVPANAIQTVRRGTLSMDRAEKAAFDYLTKDGPVFRLGNVVFERSAWETLPGHLSMSALDLHWCGTFGACSDVDHAANEAALATGTGRVVSRWHPANTWYPAFWIVTKNLEGIRETVVFIGWDA